MPLITIVCPNGKLERHVDLKDSSEAMLFCAKLYSIKKGSKCPVCREAKITDVDTKSRNYFYLGH